MHVTLVIVIAAQVLLFYAFYWDHGGQDAGTIWLVPAGNNLGSLLLVGFYDDTNTTITENLQHPLPQWVARSDADGIDAVLVLVTRLSALLFIGIYTAWAREVLGACLLVWQLQTFVWM